MSRLGGRMSGLEGKTSGCSVAWRRMSGLLAGFPGWGRMSGLDAGCPGPVGLGVWAAAAVDAPGAGCPGSWPDVRGLEGELARFRWFSSSMDLAACPSSRASSGGSS